MMMPLRGTRFDNGLESLPRAKATFIEPMRLHIEALPEAAGCLYELKLDGYRAVIKTDCVRAPGKRWASTKARSL